MIETLEKEIEIEAASKAPLKVTTIPSQKTHIFDATILSKIETLFYVKKIEAPKISEKIFDDLAQSKEKSLVRLANENRKDMRASIKDNKEVSIERSRAEGLNSLLTIRHKK